MRPVLKAATSGARKISDVVDEISEQLELSEHERSQMLPSGKQTVIANRVHWARSYLKQAGLVTNIKRGWYELSDRGREVLENPSIQLDAKYLERFDEFQDSDPGLKMMVPQIPRRTSMIHPQQLGLRMKACRTHTAG